MDEYRKLARERWSAKAAEKTSPSLLESQVVTPESPKAPFQHSVPAFVAEHEEKLPSSQPPVKLSRMLGQYVNSRPDLHHLMPENNNVNRPSNSDNDFGRRENEGIPAENKGNNKAEEAKENLAGEENGGAEASCRICGSGAEVGRLISPCLCIGTLRLVHVDCINTWRRLSANPQSYYQCDMCKYKYHVERTRFASYMQSFNVAQIATGLAALLCVLLAGIVCYPLQLHYWFYDVVEWTPFWLSSDSNLYSLAAVFNYVTAGVLGVGIIGLALDSYICIQMQNYHHIYIAIACIAHGPRHMRLVALLGFGLSGRFLFRVVREKCLELLHRWGEMILEVRRE